MYWIFLGYSKGVSKVKRAEGSHYRKKKICFFFLFSPGIWPFRFVSFEECEVCTPYRGLILSTHSHSAPSKREERRIGGAASPLSPP